ncbi:DUF3108 domain-containing protein [Bythopirellula goksoeyrii]|uniref:Tetratricopeptide repeat protein n=1 Tax=Bythopirellula goksoeyrii TaxID=1400387 RepID=A0A5B9QHN9_9BACT|nr:tetratricopeptide repeat protein [Bythopirellula goksoeyrii]QEG36496.1 Tetratricopeptide repeat protein [Bythopirellula goksoeyrii]
MYCLRSTPSRLCWLNLMASVALVTVAAPANAATASELLEKAIYTEETVGDLDQAIKVYEQVVAEGKAVEKVAAQAQLRIGLIYAKQGKTDKATAAFQAVIDNYPQAEDVVAEARKHLPREPQLLPVPWGAGDELLMEMQLPNGMGVGQQIYRVSAIEKEGQPHWECQTWQTVVINGQLGKSRVLINKETFAPIESTWKHSMLGQATGSYGKNEVVIQLSNETDSTTLKFKGQVFDNEQAAEMFRLLPLKEGYKTTAQIISTLGTTLIPLEIDVTKLETLEVPAGNFECFRLELNIGQTFWISTDEHRYIVQFRGGGVTARLSEIRDSPFTDSTNVEEPSFSVTLPPNWFAYTPSGGEKDASPTTTIIDPDSIANTRIEAGPLEPIRSKFDSPESWLKESIEKYRNETVDFKLDEKGIETTSIGGRPAASAIFQFKEGKKSMTARRITIFGETSAANVRSAVETKQLEQWEPQFAEILSTLEVK